MTDAWASLVVQMAKLLRSYPFVVFIDCVFCLLLVCVHGLCPFIVGVWVVFLLIYMPFNFI